MTCMAATGPSLPSPHRCLALRYARTSDAPRQLREVHQAPQGHHPQRRRCRAVPDEPLHQAPHGTALGARCGHLTPTDPGPPRRCRSQQGAQGGQTLAEEVHASEHGLLPLVLPGGTSPALR